MAGISELEREPSMRAQRPSSARTQRTEHVLTNIFKDILSKDGIDSTKIKRLVISQTEEPGYHRRYVCQLKNIEEEREKKLKELSRVENHLTQAYASAAIADEKRLAHATKECEDLPNLGLPSSEFALMSHLNEDLLRRHHLVTMSSFLKQPMHQETKPEAPTVPRYAKLTSTSKMRSNNKAQPKETSSAILRKPWKDQLSAADRQEGRAVLAHLEHRMTYKRNPRFAVQDSEARLDGDVFVVEPSVVSFDDYQPGQMYQLVVKVRNVSQISRQLRFIPPATPYFSISSSEFPGANGVIAPGLFFSFTLTFAPDSLADFEDQVKIQMPNGPTLTVPLEGKRLPPVLSLPVDLNCGYCLIGGQKIMEFECYNNGGKGKFRILPASMSSSDDFMDFGYVMLPPYEIQPAAFELKQNESCIVQIIFTPTAVGEYFQKIKIATDNGHVKEHIIKGASEEAKVTFLNAEESTIKFPNQNPCGTEKRIISVINHGHVDLPFHWLLTVPDCVQPDVSLVPGAETRLVKNVFTALKDMSPVFSFTPSKGVLPGQETMQFIAAFQPDNVGTFRIAASFILDNVPELISPDGDITNQTFDVASLFQRQALELSLEGQCHEFDVKIIPPLISIPKRLLIGEEHRHQFKMVNKSYSSVSFEWNSVDHLHVLSAEPSTGTISCGGERLLELLVFPRPSQLPVDTSLTCIISGKDRLTLPVSAPIKGPDVCVDVASLSFGLVRIGESATVKVPLRNASSVPARFFLHQRQEHACEVTFHPAEGEIPPFGDAICVATYKPRFRGDFTSVACLSIPHGDTRCIMMRGLAQTPSVCLDSSSLIFKELFVGVPGLGMITLHNQTLLPTAFHWMPVLGADSSFCDVKISPPFGELSPGEAKTIEVSVVSSKEGQVDDLFIPCSVEGMIEGPVYLSIGASVSDLTVSYATPTASQIHQAFVVFDDSLGLDFECVCCQADPNQRILIIRNNSAISSSFTIGPTILHPALSKETESIGKQSFILSRTPNLTDPLSRTPDKSQEEVARQYLTSNHGAVILVEPSSGILAPFAQYQIIVSAYADMWGKYSDHLQCNVAGVEPFLIPLSIDVTGSPLAFLIGGRTNQEGDYPTLRFGAHVPQVDPIKRTVRIKNRGPTGYNGSISSRNLMVHLLDIRLDWFLFSQSDSAVDDKLLDVSFWLGDPFPLVRPNGKTVEKESSLDKQLLCLDIKKHEGIEEELPFTSEPKQMLVPARSQATIQIEFNTRLPDSTAFSTCFNAFLLAYSSLDNKTLPWARRCDGLDVPPLKLGITGEVRQAWVDVEADEEEGLVFRAEASDLLKDSQVGRQVIKVHSIKLRNQNPNILKFTLLSSLPFKIMNRDQLDDEGTVLRSQASVKIRLGFLMTPEILDDVKKIRSGIKMPGHSLDSDSLQIDRIFSISYSNGSLQNLELQANVDFPCLELSEHKIDFRVVLVDETQSETVVLSNMGLSESVWELTPIEDNPAFECTSSKGILEGHRTNVSGNKTSITFSFTPCGEGPARAKYAVTGILTEQPLLIELEGSGSYDQTHSRPLTKTNKYN